LSTALFAIWSLNFPSSEALGVSSLTAVSESSKMCKKRAN